MALFEFRCTNPLCRRSQRGHYHTELVSYDDSEKLVGTTCKKCEAGKLVKVFSKPGPPDIRGYCFKNEYGGRNPK